MASAKSSLSVRPNVADSVAVRLYNAKVDAFNADIKVCDQSCARLNACTEVFNAFVKQLDGELERHSKLLDGARQLYKSRRDAFMVFAEGREEIGFFLGVNRLLADLRAADRDGHSFPQFLAQVRTIRRELSAWAMTMESD